MGLYAEIFKNPMFKGCALNGISENAEGVCLVNVEGPFEPNDKYPAVMLVENGKGMVRVVPAEFDDVKGEWVKVKSWVMMGGSYVATSDSRFSEACEKLCGGRFYGAVALHDRIER